MAVLATSEYRVVELADQAVPLRGPRGGGGPRRTSRQPPSLFTLCSGRIRAERAGATGRASLSVVLDPRRPRGWNDRTTCDLTLVERVSLDVFIAGEDAEPLLAPARFHARLDTNRRPAGLAGRGGRAHRAGRAGVCSVRHPGGPARRRRGRPSPRARRLSAEALSVRPQDRAAAGRGGGPPSHTPQTRHLRPPSAPVRPHGA